jgi:MFS transporter, ACS family, allantoate permease
MVMIPIHLIHIEKVNHKIYSNADTVIATGGITNFFSQLIVSFGYTPEQSLLYGTPGGAVEIVTLIGLGYLGDRYGHRILISISGLLVALLGIILIVALPLSNPKGRLAGYYLTQASPSTFVALLSLVSTNVAGYTKKTTVAALYLIGYCVGNIIGPQVFRPSDAPEYRPGEIVSFTIILLCMMLSISGEQMLHFLCMCWIEDIANTTEPADYHSVLGSMYCGHSFHLVVLQAAKQEEGGHQERAGIQEAGEPGVA